MASALFVRSTALGDRIVEGFGWSTPMEVALGARTCGIDLVFEVGRGGEPVVSAREVFLQRHALFHEHLLPLGDAQPPRFKEAMGNGKANGVDCADATAATVARLMIGRGKKDLWNRVDPAKIDACQLLLACMDDPACVRLYP